MNSHTQRITARMHAINFVLAHGAEISDDAAQLTDSFTNILLAFEREALPGWPYFEPVARLHVAMETVRYILSEMLESLNRRLTDHDRFEWRQKLCRLLLSYMIERTGRGPDGSLDALVDYYLLVWDGIYSAIHFRGKLLTTDESLDYGSDEFTEFTYCPN